VTESSSSSPSLPESIIEPHFTSTPALGRAEPDYVAVTGSDTEDDSYWAQYSSVQGTGDSTNPSPHLPDGKKLQLDEYGRPILSPGFFSSDGKGEVEHLEYFQPTTGEPEEARDAGDEFQLSEVQPEDVDPRDDPGDAAVVLLSHTHEDGPTSLGLQLQPTETKPLLDSPADAGSSEDGRPSPVDEALRTAIKGIFRMWEAQNSRGTLDEFVDIVRQAVEETKS